VTADTTAPGRVETALATHFPGVRGFRVFAVDRLPVLATGKVDRAALAAPSPK